MQGACNITWKDHCVRRLLCNLEGSLCKEVVIIPPAFLPTGI